MIYALLHLNKTVETQSVGGHVDRQPMKKLARLRPPPPRYHQYHQLSSPMVQQETLTRLSSSLILFALFQLLFPHSRVPLLCLPLLMASTFYRTLFPSLVRKLTPEMAPEKQGIVDAVATLSAYERNSLSWNDKKRRNLKFLGWDGYQQAKQVGYVEHIAAVDEAIKENGNLAAAVSASTLAKWAISDFELKAGISKGNGKAIEALTHYARDWTEISDELSPLLNFIKESIDKHIKNKKKTLVVVPGSGLGRIAHELALMDFPQVETCEYSSLMHACNEFVYGPEDESYTIYPFLHSYSHHVTVKNHTRSVQFTRRTQPTNLKLNYGDFREFTVANAEEYDQILIVTAFFMDTAQNMFDYFQSLEALIGKKQRGVWINVGPLKYGTAPFVELSLEEIKQVRKIRGWEDLEDPKAGEIAGYLTDKEGLWQGYYGLGKWVSEFHHKGSKAVDMTK